MILSFWVRELKCCLRGPWTETLDSYNRVPGLKSGGEEAGGSSLHLGVMSPAVLLWGKAGPFFLWNHANGPFYCINVKNVQKSVFALNLSIQNLITSPPIEGKIQGSSKQQSTKFSLMTINVEREEMVGEVELEMGKESKQDRCNNIIKHNFFWEGSRARWPTRSLYILLTWTPNLTSIHTH